MVGVAPKGSGVYYNLALSVLWPNMMLWTKREWQGQEHIKRPGGIVVAANHMSWFDPLVISHFLNDNGRGPQFMAKSTLFDVPVVGSIVGGAQQIPVYRETADARVAVSAAITAVEDGGTVVIYPEGTLSRDPDLWPMTGKTGAARVAILSGAPLLPLAHWGAQHVIRPYRKELRLFPRKKIQVKCGPPLDIDDLRAQEPTNAVFTEATVRLMDAITELEAELRDEAPPVDRWDRQAAARIPVQRQASRAMTDQVH